VSKKIDPAGSINKELSARFRHSEATWLLDMIDAATSDPDHPGWEIIHAAWMFAHGSALEPEWDNRRHECLRYLEAFGACSVMARGAGIDEDFSVALLVSLVSVDPAFEGLELKRIRTDLRKKGVDFSLRGRMAGDNMSGPCPVLARWALSCGALGFANLGAHVEQRPVDAAAAALKKSLDRAEIKPKVRAAIECEDGENLQKLSARVRAKHKPVG